MIYEYGLVIDTDGLPVSADEAYTIEGVDGLFYVTRVCNKTKQIEFETRDGLADTFTVCGLPNSEEEYFWDHSFRRAKLPSDAEALKALEEELENFAQLLSHHIMHIIGAAKYIINVFCSNNNLRFSVTEKGWKFIANEFTTQVVTIPSPIVKLLNMQVNGVTIYQMLAHFETNKGKA